MEKYLNTGIKQVISKFPALAQLLKEYEINCAVCNGNCLLKSIFEEYNLSMKEEMELTSRISGLIAESEKANGISDEPVRNRCN